MIALAILTVGLALSFFTAYVYLSGFLTGVGSLLLILLLMGNYVIKKHMEYVD